MNQIPDCEKSEGWLRDYRDGLRWEFIEGNLPQASTAYRRVMVAHAPHPYARQARYRLANVLNQLGRASEAKELLRSLTEELPESSPLRNEITRLLDMVEREHHRLGYWEDQLHQAAVVGDMERLEEAAGSLASRDDSEGVAALRDLYRKLAPADPARAVVLLSLGRSESPDVVNLIRGALAESRPAILSAAAQAVGEIGDAASSRRLMTLLSTAEPKVRDNAARALGRLRYLPAIDRLIEMARNDGNEAVRNTAATAVRCMCSARGVEALGTRNVAGIEDECGCPCSPWYQQAASEAGGPQVRFEDPREGPVANGTPRVGFVVSALSHHKHGCGQMVRPYSRQIRKAWTLQRAGFDLCLLAEAEVFGDPAFGEAETLFDPPLQVYAPGQWPRCDLMVLDGLYHLPQAIVGTVHAFCAAGGRVLMCGPVGSGWCGDSVTLRELVGVRRPHPHRFGTERIRLSWLSDPGVGRLPTVSRESWLSWGSGVFYAHDLLPGVVMAEFDSPPVWAIKIHDVGGGRVMCLNWDLGLSVDGMRDEDELFCRCVDVLLGEMVPSESAQFRMMRHIRWGEWSAAKGSLDMQNIFLLQPRQRVETIAQLFRIYLLENNRPEGERVCRILLETCDAAVAGGVVLDRVRRTPCKVQVGSTLENEAARWLDVPGWLTPTGELPLWLASPPEVPSRMHFRVLPDQGEHLRISLIGGHVAEDRTAAGAERSVDTEKSCEVQYEADRTNRSWREVDLVMTEWAALVRAEMVNGR